MTFRIVSACCQAHYTEEPTDNDQKEFDYVCSNCGEKCKRTRIGEADGVPRTQEQAYQDSFHKDGSLKYDPAEGILSGKNPKTAIEAAATTVEVRDGLIYQGDKVIGTAMSDQDWYKENFGERFSGSDEALTKIRSLS